MLEQSLEEIVTLSQWLNYAFVLSSLLMTVLSMYFCAVYNTGIIAECDEWNYRMECDDTAQCDEDFIEFGECRMYELLFDSGLCTIFLLCTEVTLYWFYRSDMCTGTVAKSRLLIVVFITRAVWCIVLLAVFSPNLETDLIGLSQAELMNILNCECDQESSYFSSDDSTDLFIYEQRITDIHTLALFLVILGAVMGAIDIIMAGLYFNSPDLPEINAKIEQQKQTQKEVQAVVQETRPAKEISLIELAQLYKGPNVSYDINNNKNNGNKDNNSNDNNNNNKLSSGAGDVVAELKVETEETQLTGKSGMGCENAIKQGKNRISWGITSTYWFSIFLSCIPGSCPIIFCAVMVPITCISNIFESCLSSTKKYLSNSIQNIVNLHKKLNELQVAAPNISFHAECWHYETRTRTVYYTDANGNQQSRIETYQEIVVTHRSTTPYFFNSWKDVSPDVKLYYLDEFKITKLKLSQQYCFKDDITRNDFYNKYNQFCVNHKFDTYQRYWRTMHISGYDDKYLASLEDNVLPPCMESTWFWVWTLIMCSPCFRTWMESKVGKKQYHIVKEISL